MDFLTKDPNNCTLKEAQNYVNEIEEITKNVVNYSDPEEIDFTLLTDKEAIKTYFKIQSALESAKKKAIDFLKRIDEDPITIECYEKKKKQREIYYKKKMDTEWKTFLNQKKIDPKLIDELIENVTMWPAVENDKDDHEYEWNSWGATSYNIVYFSFKDNAFAIEYHWTNHTNLNYVYYINYKPVNKLPELAEKFLNIIDSEVQEGFRGKSKLISEDGFGRGSCWDEIEQSLRG